MKTFINSGVDIIGVIPSDWKVKRLQYLCTINTGNQDTQNAEPDGAYPFYVRSPIIERSNNYTFDGEGILMAGDGAGAGRVFHHVFGKYAVHQRVYRLSRFSDDIDSRYLYYFLENLFPKRMDMGSAQSTVPSVRLPMLKTFQVCIPSLEEQKAISKTLDYHCSEIDAIISDLQTQIKKLEEYKRSKIIELVTLGLSPQKTKSSGVFYVGEINDRWKLSKIGYVCKKLVRTFNAEDDALICSNKGKVSLRESSVTGTMVSDDNAMQGIHQGDIAIHGMDTWHGAIAISEHSGKITRVVHVCDSIIDKRFVVYWLQSLAFQGVYKIISNGVRENTSDFRSWDKMGDVCIAFPEDANEMRIICDHLDSICREIEMIINNKKAQLEVLDEYKKSLIYEYVTGKKEVV